jgi:hypothetical protein
LLCEGPNGQVEDRLGICKVSSDSAVIVSDCDWHKEV